MQPDLGIGSLSGCIGERPQLKSLDERPRSSGLYVGRAKLNAARTGPKSKIEAGRRIQLDPAAQTIGRFPKPQLQLWKAIAGARNRPLL